MALDENLILSLVKRKVISDTFRRLSAEKKERIYRSALSLFGEYGYDGLAVDRFCRDAGLSKGSFFQYFPTKTHLLELTILVFEHEFGELLKTVRAHDHGGRTKDRLRYAIRALVELAKNYPREWRFYGFVTTALVHSRVQVEEINVEATLREYVLEILQDGQTRREIRTDLHLPLVASSAVQLAKALTTFKPDAVISHRTLEEQTITLLLEGMSKS
jgi:AcrR family transcriptional regulator